MGGLAAQGLATGAGPSDSRLRATWLRAGYMPNSVRIGDIWYDTQRLGPLGMLMSISADLYDVAHMVGTAAATDVTSALMHAFTQNILDESFLRGPSDLIRAVTDPGRYGGPYIRNFLASFTPYSVGMAQAARAMDPYTREARTMMDVLRSRVPVVSRELLPRVDLWGEPMPNPDAFIAPGITAIWERQMSTDPVNIAMWNIGMGVAPVGRTIRDVALNEQQYFDYATRAGRLAKMHLDILVRSPEFATWPNEIKRLRIEETIRQDREAARGWTMMKYPEIPRDMAIRQRARFGQ
jgi:hypothetical protein